MERKEFTFKITYFKEFGKYYTDTEFKAEIRVCDGTSTAYMSDIVAKIRGLRDQGGQDALPGLNGSNWDGYILIECEDGFPCLIKPRTADAPSSV